MNKSQEEIDGDKFYKKKEKYLKERKEFLKYQREYRLKHPLYNWVFSYEPKYLSQLFLGWYLGSGSDTSLIGSLYWYFFLVYTTNIA